MQYSTLVLAALASLASSQTVHVVSVATNGSLTYSPSNIQAAVGDMVQFQFLAGNHTITQSTFDQPCQPISQFSNSTGFHSGFQLVAAGATEIPTYTIVINNTTPIWAYCAQAKHCEAGMSMVINENTAANASRSLTNYQSAAVKASTGIPAGPANVGGNASTIPSSSAGSSGTGSSGSSSTSSSPSSSPTTGAGIAVSAPGALTFAALVGSVAMLL